MKNKVRNIIGKNVKLLRIALNLSQNQFAILTGLSRATIINIESGKTGYNLNLLDKILSFSKVELEYLTKELFQLDSNFRENLAESYKNQPDIILHLSSRPSLQWAISFKLLKDDFLNIPRETREITDYFLNFGWKYLGPSIQNELKKKSDEIIIKPHPTKKGTYLYSKK